MNQIKAVSMFILTAMVALIVLSVASFLPVAVVIGCAVIGILAAIHSVCGNDKMTRRASQFGGIAFSPIAAATNATDMTNVETALGELNDFLDPATQNQIYTDVEVGDNLSGSSEISTDISNACHLSVHGFGSGGVAVTLADGTDVVAKAIDGGEVFELPMLVNREVYPNATVSVAVGGKAKVMGLSRDAAFEIAAFAPVAGPTVFTVTDNNAVAGFAPFAGGYYDSGEVDSGPGEPIWTNGTNFAGNATSLWDGSQMYFYATLADAQSLNGQDFQSSNSGSGSIVDSSDGITVVGSQA